MDSEHRHELKTNELANWLAHFPEWAKENARVLAGAGAVILVAIGLYTWQSYSKNVRTPQQHLRLTSLITRLEQSKMDVIRKSMEGTDTSPTLKAPSEDLGMFAQQAGNSSMAATAYLQLARAIRTELHLRTSSTAAETIQQDIQQAQESYQKAYNLAKNDQNIKAAAQYGLGLCAEELDDIAEARKIYQDIVENNDMQGTAAYTAAEGRLDILATIQNTIAFLPAPAAPAPEPQTQSTDPVNDAVGSVMNIGSDSQADTAEPASDSNTPTD